MLVGLDPRNGGQIQHVARARHFHGQIDRLPVGHPLKADRHQHRAELIIGKGAVGRALHEAGDFLAGQFLSQALFHDDFGRSHRFSPFSAAFQRASFCS